jgi:hypothetical protein
LAGNTFAGGYRGAVFETYSAKRIAQGGSFKYMPLTAPNTEGNLVIRPSQEKQLKNQDLSDAPKLINAAERFLLRMAPGTASIDAILVNQNDDTDESCGLQMAVSTQHKLNHAGAIKLVNYLDSVAHRARYKIFSCYLQIYTTHSSARTRSSYLPRTVI